MKSSLKLIAVLAATFALAACETAPQDGSGTGGAGGMGAAGTPYASGSVQTLPGTDIADRVFFEYDSSALDAQAQDVLARQAAWLQSNNGITVTVEGHCDERGTREYNIALGERRAYAAKKYLVSQGVSPDRINTISYGKERPAVEGSYEDAWAQNRRAVTVVAN